LLNLNSDTLSLLEQQLKHDMLTFFTVQGNQHSPHRAKRLMGYPLLSSQMLITRMTTVDLTDLQLPVSMEVLRQEFDAVTAAIMAAGIMDTQYVVRKHTCQR